MLLLPLVFAQLAGYIFFIILFSSYLPILACGGLFHHFICSFPNQNSSLGSICGEMAELEGREPIINTPPHLLRHPKGILEKE
jgi:hypothetical protein